MSSATLKYRRNGTTTINRLQEKVFKKDDVIVRCSDLNIKLFLLNSNYSLINIVS